MLDSTLEMELQESEIQQKLGTEFPSILCKRNMPGDLVPTYNVTDGSWEGLVKDPKGQWQPAHLDKKGKSFIVKIYFPRMLCKIPKTPNNMLRLTRLAESASKGKKEWTSVKNVNTGKMEKTSKMVYSKATYEIVEEKVLDNKLLEMMEDPAVMDQVTQNFLNDDAMMDKLAERLAQKQEQRTLEAPIEGGKPTIDD